MIILKELNQFQSL